MSIHIIIADGSNPYLRYNMSPEEFAREVLKWAETFDLAFDKVVGGSIVQMIATGKNKGAAVDGDGPFF